MHPKSCLIPVSSFSLLISILIMTQNAHRKFFFISKKLHLFAPENISYNSAPVHCIALYCQPSWKSAIRFRLQEHCNSCCTSLIYMYPCSVEYIVKTTTKSLLKKLHQISKLPPFSLFECCRITENCHKTMTVLLDSSIMEIDEDVSQLKI